MKNNTTPIIIGQEGVIYLVTSYQDEDIFIPSDLENFNFTGNFSDSKTNRLYESTCHLWKPKDKILRLICELKDNLENSSPIYLNKINFIYGNYNITINSTINGIKIKQLNEPLSFLYSDIQINEIDNSKDTYELSFKQIYYDNKPLYIYKNDISMIKLNNCHSEAKVLKCNINKGEILEILSYNNESYKLVEKLDSEGKYEFISVLDIKFSYIIEQKEVKIKIGELLTKAVAKNEFIAYKTNVENISRLTSDYFRINTDKNENMECLFKKSDNQKNLLLLCNAKENGTNHLGTVYGITIDNINILNKFVIETSSNNETFNVSDIGTKISSLNPLLLNFTENDSYKIRYETESPKLLKGIKLNEYSSELDCKDNKWYKECTVNKTHFTKSDYYYTYHINHLGSNTISYEAPAIQVIVKEIQPTPTDKSDNDGSDIGLIVGLTVGFGIIILGLIAFLAWYYLKYKSKNKKDDQDGVIVGDDKDIPISSQIKEEILQSEANENRINI